MDFSDHQSWEKAYVAVESYFCALGIQNRFLLAHLIAVVLRRAAARISENPDLRPQPTAMEETMRVIAEWFQSVLGERLPEDRIASQSVLALLLADMPGKWQQWFLRKAEFPEEFLTNMREAYAEAGPTFKKRAMTPQVLELTPVGTMAGKSLAILDRVPGSGVIMAILFWGGLLFSLIALLL